MPQITTRPARIADLPDLITMIRALAAHHNDTAQINIDRLQQDIFSTHPWVRITIALADNAVIGYTALCPLVKLQKGARGLDIHHMYITPALRRQGVGRALIQDAITRASALNCSYLMVGTHPDNLAAQTAYMACGFTRTAHAPNRFILPLKNASH